MNHTSPETVRARIANLHEQRTARADKAVQRVEEIVARAKQTKSPAA